MDDRRFRSRRQEDHRWIWIEEKFRENKADITILQVALLGPDILNSEKGLLERVKRLETGEITKAARRTMIVTLMGSLLLFLGTLFTVVISNLDKIRVHLFHKTELEQREESIRHQAETQLKAKYGIRP